MHLIRNTLGSTALEPDCVKTGKSSESLQAKVTGKNDVTAYHQVSSKLRPFSEQPSTLTKQHWALLSVISKKSQTKTRPRDFMHKLQVSS